MVDFVNAHPQNFGIENRSVNRSHQDEEPDPASLIDESSKNIIRDMRKFFILKIRIHDGHFRRIATFKV